MNYTKIHFNLSNKKKLKATYIDLEGKVLNGEPLAKAILANEYFNKSYKNLDFTTAAKWICEYVTNYAVSSKWSVFYERLGRIYFEGIGKRKNYKKSFYYYHLGSRNRPECMFFLGDAYFESIGVTRDYQKALYWYKRANKELTDSKISLRIGYMYFSGLGTKVNISLAKSSYRKSSSLGSLDATYNLVLMDIAENNVSTLTKKNASRLIKCKYKFKAKLLKVIEKKSPKSTTNVERKPRQTKKSST